MNPLLQVQHLSVGIQRGRTYLLGVDDIGFQVQAGEMVGILGESGCGKTLTALSILGLLAPGIQITRGTIRFNGLELKGLSERELCGIRGKDLSMVFQEPSLNPVFTIGRQIAEPLRLHGSKNKRLIQGEVLDIMDKLGLPEPAKLAAAYPHQLSGGMRQRVMLALAIVCKPKLLIADEATTALDVSTQAQILHLLKRINRDFGTAILFISHDLGLISRLCDRLMVMYAGKILEEGTVDEVFADPRHEYTKGLMGSIPQQNQKGKPLVSIPGKVPSIEEKPPGCPFAPRCRKATSRCTTRFPEPLSLGGEHLVRCVLETEYV
ncbi:MAG: ABC transporter ATP-binding protein [Treponema sp.]|nr:ABC transporter ATP-binding protein [Treponema sp.]